MPPRQLPGQKQQQQQMAKAVQGQIHEVPCPWCGHKNDFRTIQSEQLLDTGGEHYCDACGYSMMVVAVRTVEVVAVRKNPKGGRAPAHVARARQLAAQRPQQKPGLLARAARLLGPGKG